AHQRRAEADGETQHLDAATPGDPEVAVLVDGHQHAQGNEREENHLQGIDQGCIASLCRAASSRASRSAYWTASSSPGSPGSQTLSTCSTTFAISVKRRRPSRNAVTATSLAALRAAGLSRPLPAALAGRQGHGKRGRLRGANN